MADGVNQPIFDFSTPRTHVEDPPSSHLAEARSRPSWSAKHAALVRMLDAEPGLTAPQLAERLQPGGGLWPPGFKREQEVMRRLSDLGPQGSKVLRRVYTKGDRYGRWFVAGDIDGDSA